MQNFEENQAVFIECTYVKTCLDNHDVIYRSATVGNNGFAVEDKHIFSGFEKKFSLSAQQPTDTFKDDKLRRYFIVPSNTETEIEDLHIINEIMQSHDHSTRHRILDYFKSRYNVSEAKITKVN